MPLTAPLFASNQRLQDASRNQPAIRLGEKSDGVRLLQQALLQLGYKLPNSMKNGVPDGDYGDETHQAVRQFQKDQKFWTSEIDGIVGKDTLMILDDLFSAAKSSTDRKSLARNLGFSMQAVNFVLRHIQLEAPNWDKYRREPSWEAGTAPMDRLDRALYDVVRPGYKVETARARTTLDKYRIISDWAKRNKAGNCGENSILAFMFLYDLGVRPIDRMAFDERTDHAFVVIGRVAGDPNDWKKWGASAVVCDPWAQGFRRGDKSIGTYPASEFEVKMLNLVGRWSSISSTHREV